MDKKTYFERAYFLKEDDLLKSLYDKNKRLYSKLTVTTLIGLKPEILIEKDFKLEYCDTTEIDGNIGWLEAIFENRSGFYLYLSRKNLSELNYHFAVFFEPEKINEVNFFIKNLIKTSKKNGN